ncbi:MAG: hypothetical protein CSA29_03095 [Desulfobacterales bacterium]|nr:MAG: hypothetical protein CSA29_03095 [Desulfobacterales bacterium]
MRQRCIVMAAMLLIVSGCSKLSPTPSFYLLDHIKPGHAAGHLPENFSIGIGPVRLPDHLDRAEIVTRKGDNQVIIREFHRWAAPLNRQLMVSLVVNLTTLLGTPKVISYPWDRARRPVLRVDVTILRMDRIKGQTILDAVWDIRDMAQDQILVTRHFEYAVDLPLDDVTEYVSAQSEAVNALSRQIARGITELSDRS